MPDAMEELIVSICAVGALLLSLGQLLFNGGLGFSGRLGKMELRHTQALTLLSERYTEALNRMESRLAQTIAETSRDLEDRMDMSTRQAGESITAIRQHMQGNEVNSLKGMHELGDRLSSVEKWARDEFVRKESFEKSFERLENTVAEQGRELNQGMQSLREAVLRLATGKRPRAGDDH